MKRGKKTPRQKIYDILDKMWSLLVRRKGYCEFCGKTFEVYHAHHLWGRTHVGTRWDLKNGCCLCGGCHIRVHGDSLTPERLMEKLTKDRGQEWRDYLDEKSKITVKVKMSELEEIKQALTKQYEMVKYNQ
jgi:hypothetical protein